MHQLEELFLIVVVGEFNAGKTAFLNALLGQEALAEGITPTTSTINLIRHTDSLDVTPNSDDYRVVRASVDWLRELNLVDTPGTNAVIQRHQEITETFIPRSDLVFFVTSVERPFSESERLFLQRIKEWGKKIVVVVNKIDLVEKESDLEEVLHYVTVNAEKLLGIVPEVFPISARYALRAKLAASSYADFHNNELWEASRFGDLEQYMLTTLDASQRVQLKAAKPVGRRRSADQQVSECHRHAPRSASRRFQDAGRH